MTYRAAPSSSAGFTLPEMLVALVVVSGLMLASMDALRAFSRAHGRIKGIADEVASQRITARTRDAGAPPWSASSDEMDAAWRDALAKGYLKASSPLKTRRISAESGAIRALVVERDGRPVAVAPIRVDAPSPCIFDPVARACRS